MTGGSGFLVPPADSEALDLAMARVEALPSADLARMSANARAHIVETYDRDRIASRWERLYREMLHRPDSPQRYEFQGSQG